MIKRALALAALLVALGASRADAAVTWTWSFNGGAEAGTFQTNGTAADVGGSFNFVVNPASVTMTASSFAPTLIGATFDEGSQPGTGFLWNGVTATQFYRAGGTLTNGTNYFSGTYTLLFGIIASPVVRITNTATGANTGFQDFTLTAVTNVRQDGDGGQTTTTVPEPTSLALFGAGLLGLALHRRQRRAVPA